MLSISSISSAQNPPPKLAKQGQPQNPLRQYSSLNAGSMALPPRKSSPLSQKRLGPIQARFNDRESIGNKIPYQQSQRLLEAIDFRLAKPGAPLAKVAHPEALKQLLMVGTQLLSEMERLSRHPSTTPGAFTIEPTHLVIYKPKVNAEPHILETLPGLEVNSATNWHFRMLANITKDWAKDSSPFSSVAAINLMMQSVSAILDLASWKPIAGFSQAREYLNNGLHGAKDLNFSAVERERLKEVANYYGYREFLPDYMTELYKFMNTAHSRYAQAVSGSPAEPVRLGIAYSDPKHPDQVKVKDMNQLFPGCDLKSFLPKIDQHRGQLEDLFYKA
jgi:hypothetical protein